MPWTRAQVVAPLAMLLIAIPAAAACGESTRPFTLSVHPEFVHGALAGEVAAPVLLSVEDDDGTGGAVSFEVEASGGTVTVAPAEIRAGEVAEVTFTAEPGDVEAEATITITARRGDEVRTETRRFSVIPAGDELEPTARSLLRVFGAWLATEQPELGITPETSFDGVLIAPRLLVVSHYAFFGDAYELGLSWHVTIPPDDWARLSLRPREVLTPTLAFEVSSWSAALDGGAYAIIAIEPPEQVTR